MDTAGSVQGAQASNRNRVAATGSPGIPSVSGGYSLPVNTMVPTSQMTPTSGAMTLPRALSNPSASSTPTRREQSFSPSTRLRAQRSISTDDEFEPKFDYLPRDLSLPRITTVEGLEERQFRGSLPQAGPESAPHQDGDSPRTNSRRSNRASAPRLDKDASMSSMGSNLSYATTASSMLTPGTPIDDPRIQRHTEWTTVTKSRRPGDLDQPPRPIHPPLPTYSPSLYPTFSSSQAIAGLMPSVKKVTKDIPQERRSLRNLSLNDTKSLPRESQPDRESQSRDREHAQQPNPYVLPSVTRLLPEKSSPNSYEDFNESDPLAVLAYAGRILDEEAHKPP